MKLTKTDKKFLKRVLEKMAEELKSQVQIAPGRLNQAGRDINQALLIARCKLDRLD